jgi:hypothetical protein
LVAIPYPTALAKEAQADRTCHIHEYVRFSLIAELFRARLIPTTDFPSDRRRVDGCFRVAAL